MSKTIVSCPGKVLLAGGYLVLNPKYQGFVIATPSRFYSIVESIIDEEETTTTTNLRKDQNQFKISAHSPQFLDGHWEYNAKKNPIEGEEEEWLLEEVGESKNVFIYLSIKAALLLSSALHSVPTSSLKITIVGSNDFYSQSREENQQSPIPFAPLNVNLKYVHKTGLGSSAAMVTSLTSSLFLHWSSNISTPLGSSSPILSRSNKSHRPAAPDKGDLALIHNLAQYVHSLAQGKIGSGFDVSSAVWGSHVYRRFAVECLGDLLSEEGKPKSGKALLKTLSPLFNDQWNDPATSALVSPFTLPPQTLLILADVDAGSNTPSMVGKVLAWQKASQVEADELWTSLEKSNSDLAETFATLTRLANDDGEKYGEVVAELSSQVGDQWKESQYPFVAARNHILATRKSMRIMGEASNVPIEPPSQTKLLDAVCNLPGVIGAGVPGAGGYDAIWVLVLSPSLTDSKSKVEGPEIAVTKLLNSWTEMSVKPLTRNAWAVGGDDEGERGLLREVVEEVEGLKEVLERK